MAEYKILICTDESGVARRKWVFTKLEFKRLSPAAAKEAGFELIENEWVRKLTAEIIGRETRHENWVSVRQVEESDLPADDAFRDAWVDTGSAVAVDMPKARDIHRNRLRAMRAPLLAALDVEYQRADEKGDSSAKAKIAAKKQALRDVTSDPAIDAAKTTNKLAAAVPAALELRE